MLNFLKFLFYKSRLRKRIEQVLQGSLTETSKVKISFFKKRITVTYYGSAFIGKIDSFVIFLNSAFSQDYFPISDYKIDMFKIVFMSDKLPLIARIPKRFQLKKLDIILGVDEQKKVVSMNCHINNVLLVTLPSGSGKTYALLGILRHLQQRDFNGYNKVVCIDVKRDGAFDEFESERFVIYRDRELFANFLEKESLRIMGTDCSPQLFIMDEVFLWSDARLYTSKEDKLIAIKINNFIELGVRVLRSKKQVLLILSQSPNATELPINIGLVNLKIFGFLRPSIGSSLGISTQNHLRSDFRFGRFLLVEGASEKLLRVVS